MCGLLGFSGDPKVMNDVGMAKAVLAKVKILGLYNIDRGKHSCGLFVNNLLRKGVNENKLFSDFIATTDISIPYSSKNYIIIGHTRQATHGVHTLENAHPFNVDNEFILAHNGVIRNIWTLCNKYKVNHAGITVDSKALAHLVHQEGFKVLEEYEGFAALLMYKASEPNSIYAYRGVSRKTANGNMEEERPMFYLKTAEGIYFSSMEKSLLAISDSSNDKVEQLEGNIVHKITNGKMTKAKFPVDRTSINIGVYSGIGSSRPNSGSAQTTTSFQTPMTQHTGKNTGDKSKDSGETSTNASVGKSYSQEPTMIAANVEEYKLNMLVPITFHETLPARATKYVETNIQNVFYHMGRYWVADGELIKIAHGSLILDKKGRICEQKSGSNDYYYFYEGVLMINESYYKFAMSDPDLKENSYNFAVHISKYAEYPVCNTRGDINHRCSAVSDFVKYRWYKRTNMCTNEGFTPKFSDRNYSIRNGLLHSISGQKNIEKESCVNMETLSAEKEKIKKTMNPASSKPDIVPPTSNGISITMPPAIVNNPKQTSLFTQNNPPKEETWDTTNFYRIFTSIEQLMLELDSNEKDAVRFYVADIMRHEMEFPVKNIYEDPVEVQMKMFFQMVVDRGVTLMDIWDDNNYPDVIDYLKLAKKNKTGDVPAKIIGLNGETLSHEEEPAEEDNSFEACVCIPKTEKDESADPKDDEELPVTDIHFEEMSVPNSKQEERDLVEETLSQYEQNEIIKFSVQDVIDYVLDVRDCADDLVKADTDFSNEAANLIYRTVDPFVRSLRAVFEAHGQEEAIIHLNKRLLAQKKATDEKLLSV